MAALISTDSALYPVSSSTSPGLTFLSPSRSSDRTVSTAMALATSPAWYPPMPSASTARPMSLSLPMESSLCDRFLPTSVTPTISSFPSSAIPERHADAESEAAQILRSLAISAPREYLSSADFFNVVSIIDFRHSGRSWRTARISS